MSGNRDRTDACRSNRAQVRPETVSDARMANMRRVLVQLYWKWIEDGMPMRN